MKDEPLLLDTHCWIWLEGGISGKFSAGGLAAVRSARTEARLWVSVISVWEVALLEARGRISLRMDCAGWIREALATPGLSLAPLTPEIAVESTRLPGGLHGDPADRIIVATARAYGARLLTKDRKLLDYARGKHLRVVPA